MDFVYIGKDNSFRKRLYLGDDVADLSTVTKVELQLNGTLFSSLVETSAFDLTDGANGYITFTLGGMSGLSAGIDKAAELVIYSTTYPNGAVWGRMYIVVTTVA